MKYALDVGESTPLSPAMQAVLCLVAIYYACYMLTFIAGLRKSLAAQAKLAMGSSDSESTDDTEKTKDGEAVAAEQSMAEKTEAFMTQIADESQATMDMVPMLAILIVFARLRAKVDLEGTNPPDYARKAFYGATAIIYIMAFREFLPLFAGWFFLASLLS